MKYRYLSHLLKDNSPAYGGGPALDMRALKSITAGDSANTYRLSLENHLGTHVDAPNHFFEKGRKIADYPAGAWAFKAPEAVSVSLKPSEILRCGRWLEAVTPAADILLVRSGWSGFRSEARYVMENPGIDPDLALCLRKRYPKIRAIGIDWISVSSYNDRPLGARAHKAFLDPGGENGPIAIIEDMDLSCGLEGLREVIALPLRVEGIDSAPCTVIGGFLD